MALLIYLILIIIAGITAIIATVIFLAVELEDNSSKTKVEYVYPISHSIFLVCFICIMSAFVVYPYAFDGKEYIETTGFSGEYKYKNGSITYELKK